MSALARCLLIGCICLLSFPSHAQITKEQAVEIDQVFAKWNRTDRPGAAMAIVHNGTIIYEKGYGMADL